MIQIKKYTDFARPCVTAEFSRTTAIIVLYRNRVFPKVYLKDTYLQTFFNPNPISIFGTIIPCIRSEYLVLSGLNKSQRFDLNLIQYYARKSE